VSQVDVQTSSGIEPRTVIFASKGDLPKVLREFFKEANIPVIRATPAEDHAEIAARVIMWSHRA